MRLPFWAQARLDMSGSIETAFVDRVGELVPLSRVERQALEALAQSTFCSLAPGEALAQEATPVTCWWIVRTGWAYCHRGSSATQGQVLGFLIPGDVVGLNLAALAQERRLRGLDVPLPLPFSITALTPLEAIMVSEDAFGAFAAQHLRTTRALLAQLSLAAELDRYRRAKTLPTRASLPRLADQVVTIADRLAKVGIPADNQFEFPVSQSLFANFLGMTSVHVSRLLAQLRRDGVMTVTRGRVATITIHDPLRLRAIAAGCAEAGNAAPPPAAANRPRAGVC